MQKITFDDFLQETLVLRQGFGIQECKLFHILKEFCKDHQRRASTWAEFHQFLKRRNAQKMQFDGMTVLIGYGWNRRSAYCPDDATDHAVPTYTDRVLVHRFYHNTASKRRIIPPELTVPVCTPPIPDDDDPAPWD